MRQRFRKCHSALLCLRDRLFRDECGQDLIEYALLLALIALAATAGMSVVANKINDIFMSVGSKVSTYTS